ncbi:hypothetical protein Tco_0602521 [Tanacetum coccineum]
MDSERREILRGKKLGVYKVRNKGKREAESHYQSSRSRKAEPIPRKRYHEGVPSQRMEVFSESEDSGGGRWKSRSKKQKSSIEEDDLSQPWVCVETDPFTPRIHYFDSPKKTRMPSNVKTYDGIEDPKDHLKIFQAAAKVEPKTRQQKGSAKSGKEGRGFWEGQTHGDPNGSTIAKVGQEKGYIKLLPQSKNIVPTLRDKDGAEGPMIIETKIGRHFIHHIYVDGGSALEIVGTRNHFHFTMDLIKKIDKKKNKEK